jgi:tungstate transport system substrate-binding protein
MPSPPAAFPILPLQGTPRGWQRPHRFFLINTYHALCQPAGATPGQALAAEFTDFVASDQGQTIIRDFGSDRHGAGLYNDAAYAKQYDH